MKIALQTASGVPVRDLEIPRMTPYPQVVTLGARAFSLFRHDSYVVVYRETFMVSLEGYLPGQGLTDPRTERA